MPRRVSRITEIGKPGEYVPLATRTIPPSMATSTAVWMSLAALAQES